MPLAALTQGALASVSCKVYPWVGAVFDSAIEGDAYPSPNLTLLKFTNDRTGGFGIAYAYVTPGASGGTVSATPATGAAAPFPTAAAAAVVIKTCNNANFGRNNVSGGIIRLNEGGTSMLRSPRRRPRWATCR